MIDQTYGLKVPQNGDTGAVLFPAFEAMIAQIDAHTHDGLTSAKLTTAASNVVTQAVEAASWGASLGNGRYRQTITLPVNLSYDNILISMRLTATGHQVFPTIEKVSSTQYYVYTNDNSVAFTAVYSS